EALVCLVARLTHDLRKLKKLLGNLMLLGLMLGVLCISYTSPRFGDGAGKVLSLQVTSESSLSERFELRGGLLVSRVSFESDGSNCGLVIRASRGKLGLLDRKLVNDRLRCLNIAGCLRGLCHFHLLAWLIQNTVSRE